MFSRELAKLEKDIGGIQDMAALPDAIFVIDVGFHKIAIAEAKKLGIPSDRCGGLRTTLPKASTTSIPGNDDSAKAVALYARGIADAILEGREAPSERSGQGCCWRRLRRIRGSGRVRCLSTWLRDCVAIRKRGSW